MVVSINKVASSIMSQPRSISHVAEPVVSVPKTLTEIDALNFRTYIHAKTFDFKATQEELNALFKFDGDEFFVKTYDFFIKKLGISENLKPPVINQPAHQSVGMTYDFCQNLITRNSILYVFDISHILSVITVYVYLFISSTQTFQFISDVLILVI